MDSANNLAPLDLFQILDRVYPIGSLYSNKTDSRNPNKIFGFGTWGATLTDGLSGASNPYRARAYRTAAWNSAVGDAKLNLDTENYDPNNNFSGGTYTVPITGYYDIKARIEVPGGTIGVLVVKIYKNGSPVSFGNYGPNYCAASLVSDTLLLTAGDTIELWQYANGVGAGATQNLSASTFLSINLVATSVPVSSEWVRVS